MMSGLVENILNLSGLFPATFQTQIILFLNPILVIVSSSILATDGADIHQSHKNFEINSTNVLHYLTT